MMVDLPCKIGDVMYIIRRYGQIHRTKSGEVNQMYFTDDMQLVIAVKSIGRGMYGDTVFDNEKDADNKRLERGNKNANI